MFGFRHAFCQPAPLPGLIPGYWDTYALFSWPPSSLCVGYYRPTLWELIEYIISPHAPFLFPFIVLLTWTCSRKIMELGLFFRRFCVS